jgi:hypothetical protein
LQQRRVGLIEKGLPGIGATAGAAVGGFLGESNPLAIGGGVSYSGGRGGNSGPVGRSGAGGGGGGATVIVVNSGVIGLAGGGAGGGGGGNTGAAAGGSAPGPNGQAAPGENAGQNGTNKASDGGGGGGGGGGFAGGQGGTTLSGDQGGYAGYYGSGQGNATANPSGRTPGGNTNTYRRGAGQGGASNGGLGTAGTAMFEFDVSGVFVHNSGSFTPVVQTYIKANDAWNTIKSIYIKQNGTWVPVNGSSAPAFANVPNRFGVNPRSGVVETQAGDVVSPGGEGGGYDGGGGGGGGGKVICTALYELGYMEKEIFEYDQAYGLWLYQNDFVSYRGYRAWADVLVRYVKGETPPVLPKLLFWKTAEQQQRISQQMAIFLSRLVGGAFSKEIARRAGHNIPFSVGGWLCVTVGLSVNRMIGYIVKKTKKNNTIDYKE